MVIPGLPKAGTPLAEVRVAMTTKVLIISAFGAAAVAAAAAGGYLALRSNATDLAAVQTSTAPPAVEASGAVIEPAQKPEAERVPEVPAVHGTTPRSAHPGAASAPAGAQAPAASGPRPEAPAPVTPASAPVVSPDPAPAEVKDPRPEPVPAPVIEPARPVFEEVVVKEDSVIGIRLDGAISTETAHVEDPVTARVARDVTVGGHVAIPAGARLEGSVSVVEHGGKFKDRPRLGIQFHSSDPRGRHADQDSDRDNFP